MTPPRPLAQPSPAYPDTATVVLRRGDLGAGATVAAAEGRVRLRLLVRSDGSVSTVDILVSSGHPDLDRAAVAALARWRFQPATRDRVPIDAYYQVWVVFRLE
jgi:protein TonB